MIKLIKSSTLKIKSLNMKKLRMIITSVIVLTIVGSVVAFNAEKSAVFCVGMGPTCPVPCTTIIKAKRIVQSRGIIYCYRPDWLGDSAQCLNPGSNCPMTVRLGNN
jgi:hypothetical protein